MGIKGADVEDEFLLKMFSGFLRYLDLENATDYPVFSEWLGCLEVKSGRLLWTHLCHIFKRLEDVCGSGRRLTNEKL